MGEGHCSLCPIAFAPSSMTHLVRFNGSPWRDRLPFWALPDDSWTPIPHARHWLCLSLSSHASGPSDSFRKITIHRNGSSCQALSPAPRALYREPGAVPFFSAKLISPKMSFSHLGYYVGPLFDHCSRSWVYTTRLCILRMTYFCLSFSSIVLQG